MVTAMCVCVVSVFCSAYVDALQSRWYIIYLGCFEYTEKLEACPCKCVYCLRRTTHTYSDHYGWNHLPEHFPLHGNTRIHRTRHVVCFMYHTRIEFPLTCAFNTIIMIIFACSRTDWYGRKTTITTIPTTKTANNIHSNHWALMIDGRKQTL